MTERCVEHVELDGARCMCFASLVDSGHRKESQVMTERCVEHVELGGARCMCFASLVVADTARRVR